MGGGWLSQNLFSFFETKQPTERAQKLPRCVLTPLPCCRKTNRMVGTFQSTAPAPDNLHPPFGAAGVSHFNTMLSQDKCFLLWKWVPALTWHLCNSRRSLYCDSILLSWHPLIKLKLITPNKVDLNRLSHEVSKTAAALECNFSSQLLSWPRLWGLSCPVSGGQQQDNRDGSVLPARGPLGQMEKVQVRYSQTSLSLQGGIHLH